MQARDYTYEVLKLVEAGEEPTREKLGLSKEDFIELLSDIKDDGLVDNISFSQAGNRKFIVFTNNLSLTRLGKELIRDKESGKI
nr:hypothetical protein [Aneurinibacillus sp. XH2]